MRLSANGLNSNVSTNFCTSSSINLGNFRPNRLILESSLSFKGLVQDFETPDSIDTTTKSKEIIDLLTPANVFPKSPVILSPQHDAAALKLQKVYKSYRTRRNLADCAVVVEELWWKALDYGASSASFFDVEKPETALSRWARVGTMAAKVGKGLLKDDKAQKLALQHWLEAIDPRHRYGHNLRIYYNIWFTSESGQPFFFWLDVGDGKEINLEKCPRMKLQHQCIKYLGPKERESYEVIVQHGKLVYKQSGVFVNTIEDSKWIFVLSTSRTLYIGQKKKGLFQHSSFLAGAATTSAGRLVAHGGILQAIWPYSGHYHPTEENFKEFISFLEENLVDLSNVKKCAVDDDLLLTNVVGEESSREPTLCCSSSLESKARNIRDIDDKKTNDSSVETPVNNTDKHSPRKWSTGAGPRISCVRDYPAELQARALEQVNLSPTSAVAPSYGPIPSPRPSPKIHLSPRTAYGLISPKV